MAQAASSDDPAEMAAIKRTRRKLAAIMIALTVVCVIVAVVQAR